MMRLTPLPAFQDDYLWFLHDGRRAQRERLELDAILVMRHDPDPVQAADAMRLTCLPGETRGCGTHAYTLGSLKLALPAEPGNLQLINYDEPVRHGKNGFR